MNLTSEQQEVVESNEDLRVNAVAGSGKSYSLLAYAKSKQGRILYLAYNKVIQEEISRKAKAQGISMDVLTTHSLAYRGLKSRGYNIDVSKQFNYTMFKVECQVLFNLRKEETWGLFKKLESYLNYWSCTSISFNDLLDQKHVLGRDRDVMNHVFQKMCRFELPVAHDFYLKIFSRLQPQLGYDYILVDESQDLSAPTLEIVSSQNQGIKVFVGDENQSIYGFRYAMNALDSELIAGYRQLYLTQSFRYTQRIANIANEVLSWKSKYSDYEIVPIRGLNEPITVPNRAIITRTNFTLLNQAYIIAQQGRSLYIEGNLNLDSFHKLICDFNRIRLGQEPILPYLPKKKDLKGCKEMYAIAEDFEMLNLVRLVEDFKSESVNIIPRIQRMLTTKENADIVLTNTHKSKGLEYNSVMLTDDFIKYSDINEDNAQKMNLDEEINLLYVALTRTTNELILPFNENRLRLSKLQLY